jgi:CRISPR-associated protein Cmr2
VKETALLTFSIGPVHSFIEQARRVADVWAGSYLLSHLTRQAISVAHRDPGSEMIFPFIRKGEPVPNGVPNRFVCRVPLERVAGIASKMKKSVQAEWRRLASGAAGVLEQYALWPEGTAEADGLFRQTERLLDFSWSWVAERGDYATASREGARRFAASRMFRPFPQIRELGEKCAICGERAALPNGNRGDVQRLWAEAEEKAKANPEHKRFLRADQGRLCLVCATKRFFPLDTREDAHFDAFDEFQPSDDAPYFALVSMDGDRMSTLFSLPADAVAGRDLERFHQAVSTALTGFAAGLRTDASTDLLLEELGVEKKGRAAPQVIYAGGDDVLLICDPRDALPLARALRERYVAAFEEARRLLIDPEERDRFTVSTAILFAHPGHPAGLLLHELEDLLHRVAKDEGGRNAVAIRLAKRGGEPVEVVLPWEPREGEDGTDWVRTLDELVQLLQEGAVSSRQTFTLRLEERTLREVFGGDADRWELWLTDRLSRNEGAAGAEAVAGLVAPFFLHDRTPVLRIARFLGVEALR